jgi:hypothetical protein
MNQGTQGDRLTEKSTLEVENLVNNTSRWGGGGGLCMRDPLFISKIAPSPVYLKILTVFRETEYSIYRI